MTGPALRLLHDNFRSSRLNDSGYLFGLMAHHRYDCSRFQWGARDNHMFHQVAAAGSMQYFCQAGLEPRAFSRSENHNGKIVGRHRPIILREQNQFRNAAINVFSDECLICGGNRCKSSEGSLGRLVNGFVCCDGPKRGVGQKPADQLCVQRVTGLVRLDVPEQWKASQGKVADQVERLVASEFIGEAERPVHYSLGGKNYGIVQRTAANQPHRAQRLNVAFKAKGTRAG